MENAETMAVQGLFKKLKANIEDLKGMIGDLHDLQHLKDEYFQVERELVEK